MPPAGISRRAARHPAASWWEELDREAFREFPGVRGPRTAAVPKPASEGTVAPVRAPARLAVADRAGGVAGAGRADGIADGVARVGRADGADAMPADRADWSPRASDGRRTVTIRGYGAERNLPVARPTLRRHERPGFKPDRAALWAVVLGLVLILVAAASAHAAVAHHVAGHLIR